MPREPNVIVAAATVLAPSPDHLYVGTSGWAYTTWKPGFYPPNVPARRFLHFYGSLLPSVEVNYTFRTLPTVTQLEGWLHATPPGFKFSFKAPQRITHFQRLRGSHDAIAEFVAAVAPARLAGKLGPLLFQLPPNFAVDPTRLGDALAASELMGHQIAFEFRHASWFCDEIYSILRHHKAALCVAESDDLATPDVATADFRCYRLRRNGGYDAAAIKAFGSRFAELASAGEVYVYLKHEDEPTGALNAIAMLHRAQESVPQGLKPDSVPMLNVRNYPKARRSADTPIEKASMLNDRAEAAKARRSNTPSEEVR